MTIKRTRSLGSRGTRPQALGSTAAYPRVAADGERSGSGFAAWVVSSPQLNASVSVALRIAYSRVSSIDWRERHRVSRRHRLLVGQCHGLRVRVIPPEGNVQSGGAGRRLKSRWRTERGAWRCVCRRPPPPRLDERVGTR